MITKYVLIIWIGAGQTQSIGIDHFDTLPECNAAAKAVYSVTSRQKDYHICKAYTFDGETK